MNRSIEVRLERLEAASPPDEAPRGSHIVTGRTREETDAKIAALIAAGEAAPTDFLRILPLEADPDSVMHENYRWEGRWVRKDGRTDIP
jgi:hypothetical protein